jgi:predicted RND superfamily exporter protein
MSLFTVVGLLGMTGIIINDSIVLITTIDEYSRTRGTIPALVDAVSDRLRPVMLTTLTTVLGLAPLLYESSLQAQFLKPTVITLCYGLGAGMFLVLLVVPAIIAIQMDVGRIARSLRRALLGRHLPRGARMTIMGAAGVNLALTAGAIALAARPGLWPALGAADVPLFVLLAGALIAVAVVAAILVPLLTPRPEAIAAK